MVLLLLSTLTPTMLICSVFAKRARRPTAFVALLASSTVLGGALVAELTNREAWREGGWDVVWVTIVAAFSTAAAVAYRRSKSRASLAMALAGACLTPLTAALTYWWGMNGLGELLRHASPEDVARITDAMRPELLRAPQLAAVLAVGIILITLSASRTPAERA